jgi:hypothetical protein
MFVGNSLSKSGQLRKARRDVAYDEFGEQVVVEVRGSHGVASICGAKGVPGERVEEADKDDYDVGPP